MRKDLKKQLRTKGLRISNNTVTKYVGEEKDVVVPEGVTKIGAKAFNMTGVRSISLPSTLKILTEISYVIPKKFANHGAEMN